MLDVGPCGVPFDLEASFFKKPSAAAASSIRSKRHLLSAHL